VRTFLVIAVIVMSLGVLELARRDVIITEFEAGKTPITEYATADSDGPVVIVAHGFAGSQQMMQGYALPLARAGYRVFAFEFLGHGRNPIPMSGDVTQIDGTTRLLVDQTNAVINAVSPGKHPVALIGHSMATDILVRVAATRTDVGPVVLISAFSKEITATFPKTLLLVTGAWESGLRAFAQDALRSVDMGASEGETVTNGPVIRRAVAAPFAEHVSVLQSRLGRSEALAWLDRAFGRRSDVAILPTGWAILGLLCGLVLLFRSIAERLPKREHPHAGLSRRHLTGIVVLPMIVTPLVAVPLNPGFLPVLVADYLVLHLFVFAALQLGLLWLWGVGTGRFSPKAFCALGLWSILFGLALNRYAANFQPTSERLWIIVVMMLGAVPYMMADAILTTGAPLLRRLVIRLGFFLSLGFAVALDPKDLFFLAMIAPVLILFFFVFGTMGRYAARTSGPLAPGIALGLVLAWALGVSFPLFQS